MKNFDVCIERVLKDEGGYTNNPNDSGGPTNYGITIGDVRKYVKRNATAQDVRNLTLDQAKSIYKSKYWDSLGCDGLAAGVDYTCFDYGVNSGLGRPRKALQKFSGKKGADLINSINDERTTFLKNLVVAQPKDQEFLKGWLTRVNRVRQTSLTMADKNNALGPSVAVSTASVGVGLSQYLHSHQTIILAGALVLAVALGFVVHYLRNKNG